MDGVEFSRLLQRAEGSMVLAIRQHYQLPAGTKGRDDALRDAADYASVLMALRARAASTPSLNAEIAGMGEV